MLTFYGAPAQRLQVFNTEQFLLVESVRLNRVETSLDDLDLFTSISIRKRAANAEDIAEEVIKRRAIGEGGGLDSFEGGLAGASLFPGEY